MKLISKIKKIIYSVGVFLAMLPLKICWAYNITNPEIVSLYGVPYEEPVKRPEDALGFVIIKYILMFIIVPITFIVGIKSYKDRLSGSDLKKKIITTCAYICMIASMIFMYFAEVNYTFGLVLFIATIILSIGLIFSYIKNKNKNKDKNNIIYKIIMSACVLLLLVASVFIMLMMVD